MGNLSPYGGEIELGIGPGLELVEPASPIMGTVESVIRELAQSEVPVLLFAESGAGKCATARRIHQMSRQSTRPFRSLLCSSLTLEDLEEGTGSAKGLLNEGTLYLAEVGNLTRECQTYLLEELSKSFSNGDGARARLICGSTRDLEADVKTGKIREDFYYRISGLCLRLPPLRQRKEDIPGLLNYFLRKYANDFHRALPELSEETRERLRQYSWPGNLRELEDAAKVLVVVGDQKSAAAGLRALQTRPARGSENAKVSLKAASKAASREAEKELILKTLSETRWNRRRAAQLLQISYKALLYKLKQIGCEGYGAS